MSTPEATYTGRPPRRDQTVRATSTLNVGVHTMLKAQAAASGRDAGQQIEQAILAFEAMQQLEAEGKPFTLGAVVLRARSIWEAIERETKKV